MERKLTLLLAMLLLASSAVGCGDAGNNTTETTGNVAADTTADTTEEESTESYDTGLPDQDFGGRTFTFYTKNDDSWVDWFEFSIYAEEMNGEVLNDAVFSRNSYVQEKCNVVLAEYAPNSGNFTSEIGNAIQAGDSQYDVVMPALNHAGELVLKGYLLDLNEVDNINLSQNWWDQRSISDLSLANKLYMVSGDISMLNADATWCTMINLSVLNDLGAETPYQYVAEDNWNFDTYKALCENASIDLNGDGVYDKNDSIANLTQNENATAMLVCFGYHMIEKDENDLPIFTLEGNERAYTILQDLSEFMNDDRLSLNYHTKGSADGYHLLTTKMFQENRGLFWITNLQMVRRLREMETDFGIAPVPKYDEQQENYCNVVWQVGSYVTVPITAANSAESGYILETISAKSRELLRPAYYETALSKKYLRDEESVEMLDLVIDNRSYELELAFSFGVSTAVNSIVLNEKEPASTFASSAKSIAANIEKALDKIGAE